MAEKEKQGWVWLIVIVAAGIILAQAVGERLWGIFVPFVAAYVMARLARPAGVFLSRLWRMKEKTGCTLYAIFLCVSGAVIITLLSGKLMSEIKDLILLIPEYASDALEMIRRLVELLPLPESNTTIMEILTGMVGDAASQLGNKAAGVFTSVVQSFPSGILAVFAFVLGFIYLTSDLPGIASGVREFVPRRAMEWIDGWFGELSGAIFAYLRAYLIMFSFTFVLLAIGLWVIGAGNSFATALIVAMIDALPVLGCGTVLIPWAVWEFLSDRATMGIGLIAIWLIVYVMRQVIEPKLIGKMSGAHPFIALVFLYVGWKIGGVGGMLASPVILLALCQIKRSHMSEIKDPVRKNVPEVDIN